MAKAAGKFVFKNTAKQVANTAENVAQKETSTIKRVNPKSLIGRQSPNEMTGSKVKRYYKDMKTNGYKENYPIDAADVNGKLIILDGHHRAAAAAKADMKEVPVNVHSVSKEQGNKLIIEVAEAYVRDYQCQ